jgi:IS1 family transposase
LLKHNVHIEGANVNRLTTQDRARILTVLAEGMGVNAACRVTGVSKNTVLKLLADVGRACAAYQDQTMRNLTCTQLQVDEIWSFIGMKQKNVPADADPMLGLGDCYTYTAIDPVTKLMPCWMVGYRTSESADHFMGDLAPRLANRIQLTTDAMHGYPKAVAKHFGGNVDFAVLNKSYEGGLPAVEAKRRYSPAVCVGATKNVVCGSPEMKQVSTSHVERANLSMRMGMRRFTRLTNAFSKKMENYLPAISFYFMVYNFVKIHGSVKTTPAIAAGVTSTQWTMEDIAMMAETVTFDQPY